LEIIFNQRYEIQSLKPPWSTMTLLNEVESNRKTIRTDGYPMSVGELATLYKDKELDLHPEFQRYFRWTDEQKSKLIESLLLGIPIPSIFVHQRKDGVWDVVDGLQRISSVFEVMGILRDSDDELLAPLRLTGTKYLPSLENKSWGSNEADPAGLGGELQRILKRSKLDIKIVLRESDADTRLELFQRLNTGGSPLTRQELRNCLVLMYNVKANDWIQSLSRYPAFQNCIALSDKALEEQYDIELVTRYFCLKQIDVDSINISDLGAFLDEKILSLISDENFDFHREETNFKKTFDVLEDALADKSFRRFSVKNGRFGGGFLVSVFEVIAMGLGHHMSDDFAPQVDVSSIPSKIWQDKGESIGSGLNASRRLKLTLPLGRSLFK